MIKLHLKKNYLDEKAKLIDQLCNNKIEPQSFSTVFR